MTNTPDIRERAHKILGIVYLNPPLDHIPENEAKRVVDWQVEQLMALFTEVSEAMREKCLAALPKKDEEPNIGHSINYGDGFKPVYCSKRNQAIDQARKAIQEVEI